MGNEASREATADSHIDAEKDDAPPPPPPQPQDHFDLSAIADGIESGPLDEEVNLSPERPPPPQPRHRQREMSAKAPAKPKAKKTRKATKRTRGHGQERASQLPVVLQPEWEPSEEERQRVRLESPEMHGDYEFSEMGDPVGTVADEVYWRVELEQAEASVNDGDGIDIRDDIYNGNDIDDDNDGSNSNNADDVDMKDSDGNIYSNTDDDGMNDNENDEEVVVVEQQEEQDDDDNNNDNDVLRILNGESHGSDHADGVAEGPSAEQLLNDGKADDMVDPQPPAGAAAEDGEGKEGKDEDEDEALPALPASDPEDQFLSPRSEPSARSRASSHVSTPDDDPGKIELTPSPGAHIEPSTHNATTRGPVQIFDYVEIPTRRTAEPDDPEDDSQQDVYEIDASDTAASDKPAASDKKLKFQCPHCPQSFVTRSKMNRHVLVHAPPQFICPFCDDGTERLFRRRDKALDHIKRCHSSHQLKDASNMTLHINSPSVQPRAKQIQELPAANTPRFPCPFAAKYSCSKTFQRQKTAARHGRTHQQEYPCICGKVFLRNDNLVAHFRSKHPDADIHLLKPREKPISPSGENVQRDPNETSKKRKLPANLHTRTSDHPAQPPHKKSRTADSSTSHHSLDSGIAMADDDYHNPSPSHKSPAPSTDHQRMDEDNDESDKDGYPEPKTGRRIPNKRPASSAKAKAAKGANRCSPQEDEVTDSNLDYPASFCRICNMPFHTKRAKIEHDRNKKVHWYLEQCNTCRRRYHSHSALRQHQIDTGHHSSQDQLPKDSGHFTAQEEAKLNNWRARFCHEHSLTESEFNDLMTDTRKVRASDWPHKFVSRRELLDAYYDVLPRRSRKSLRRYRDNHFHNGDKGAKWSLDVDEDIIRLYKTLGPKWAIIAESVGRGWPSVRRRYLDTLQYADKLEKGAWSVDENVKFNQAIDQVQQLTLRSPGDSFNWQAVSGKVGTRSPQQCSNHWRSIHGTLIGNRWRKSAAPDTSLHTSPRLSRMEQRLNSELPSNLSPEPIVDSDEEASLNSAPPSDAESSHDLPISEEARHFSSPIINDVIQDSDRDAQYDAAASNDQGMPDGISHPEIERYTEMLQAQPITEEAQYLFSAIDNDKTHGTHSDIEQDTEISWDQPTSDGAQHLSAAAADDVTYDSHSDIEQNTKMEVNDPSATDAELSGEEMLPKPPSVEQTPRPSIALTQAFEQTQAHTSAYREPQHPAPSQDQPSPSVAIELHIQRSTPVLLPQASHPFTTDTVMSEQSSNEDSGSESSTTSLTSAKASKRDEASSHGTDSEESDNTTSSWASARASRKSEASSHNTDSEESDSETTSPTSVGVHAQTPSVHVQRTPAHSLFPLRAQSDSGSSAHSKDKHVRIQQVQSSQTPAPRASSGLGRLPLQNRCARGRHARAFTVSESDSDDKGPKHPAPGSYRPNWARKPRTLSTDNNQDFINSIQESARSQKRRLEEFRRLAQYYHTNEGESD